MPITKSTGYLDSSGVMHATVEEAQASELRVLLNEIDGTGRIASDVADQVLNEMADDMVKRREDLLAILTIGPRSRPTARKAKGTTNPRRAAKRSGAVAPVPATPDQAKAAGFEAMREATEAAA